MEPIKNLKSAEDVAQSYKENGVSKSRRDSLNDNFTQLPSEFKVHGLIYVNLVINKRELKNIPAFAIDEEGKKYVLVGTFKQTYTNKKDATEITKEGSDYKGKFLVVNNCKVHKIFEGKSEADLIVDVIGKRFHTAQIDPLPVFVPKYTADQKPIYGETAQEALDMVTDKSYVKIIEGERP